ncbi:hypothetical protein BC936DRAFT_145707 [Jimgerdemannia flammicorona]|uniref:Zn(2)-C6 fungal-type domain-containing protein n=1 Tax=Jimgerdemannia flammicorona TaxID=994334 RepID=A0A433D9F5_9FUNG|nr:hypothetical protein BC936DRAFT_145707 [Jimgerdemannia flammicorona]
MTGHLPQNGSELRPTEDINDYSLFAEFGFQQFESGPQFSQTIGGFPEGEIRIGNEHFPQQPRSRTSSRTRQACDPCAKAKRRCESESSGSTSCEKCAKSGKDCTYKRPQKRPSRTSLRSRSSSLRSRSEEVPPLPLTNAEIPPLPGFRPSADRSLKTNDPMDEDHVGSPASDLCHTPDRSTQNSILSELRVIRRALSRIGRQFPQSRSRHAQDYESEQEEGKSSGQDGYKSATSHTPKRPLSWPGLPKLLSGMVHPNPMETSLDGSSQSHVNKVKKPRNSFGNVITRVNGNIKVSSSLVGCFRISCTLLTPIFSTTSYSLSLYSKRRKTTHLRDLAITVAGGLELDF